ncbi:MAG TPA: SDR family oxidoreductase [bacterium]|nr:SDR family oxidoreductase [bacterium]
MKPLSVQDTLRGKRILLTGASGFLGKVWLGMVLSRIPDVEKIHVLIRGKAGHPALQRMEEILNASPVFGALHESYGAELEGFLSSRLDVLEGDVGDPRFGLSEDAVRRLSGKVDLIVNVAGLVDFRPDLRKSFRTNVQGSLHALELARTFGCPLLHISTAFVAGSRDGLVAEFPIKDYAPSDPDFDAEKDFRELEALTSAPLPAGGSWVETGLKRAQAKGWPNAYSYMKSLSESLLWSRAGDVPVSVFRPAIVESAQSFPFPGWNEGVTTCAPLSYMLSRWTRVLRVEPSHTLDLVPVDTVCEGMTVAAAALLKGRAKPVYHCGTSDRNPLTVRFAVELMGLSHREHERGNGKRSFEKKILSRMAPHFVGSGSFFTAEKMRRLTTLLLEASDLFAPHLPDSAKNVFEFGRRALRGARWDLIKAEKVLEAFNPYLAVYDYRFATDNLRSHAVAEPEFRFRPESISWSRYIVTVHEPGLRKWCYPLMEGGSVETYRPARRCRLGWGASDEAKTVVPMTRGGDYVHASAKGS